MDTEKEGLSNTIETAQRGMALCMDLVMRNPSSPPAIRGERKRRHQRRGKCNEKDDMSKRRGFAEICGKSKV